jgi:hypothetical protein
MQPAPTGITRVHSSTAGRVRHGPPLDRKRSLLCFLAEDSGRTGAKIGRLLKM